MSDTFVPAPSRRTWVPPWRPGLDIATCHAQDRVGGPIHGRVIANTIDGEGRCAACRGRLHVPRADFRVPPETPPEPAQATLL